MRCMSRVCLRNCAISMDLLPLGQMIDFQDDKGTLTNVVVVEYPVNPAF